MISQNIRLNWLYLFMFVALGCDLTEEPSEVSGGDGLSCLSAAGGDGLYCLSAAGCTFYEDGDDQPASCPGLTRAVETCPETMPGLGDFKGSCTTPESKSFYYDCRVAGFERQRCTLDPRNTWTACSRACDDTSNDGDGGRDVQGDGGIQGDGRVGPNGQGDGGSMPDNGPVAELMVSPVVVNFGPLQVGARAEQTVRVTNVGSEVANINAIEVDGFAGLSVTINMVDVVGNAEFNGDPDGDGSPGLAVNESFELTVLYEMAVADPVEGTIHIRSDAVNSDVRIAVSANQPSPCIHIVPGTLEFGAALIGRPNESFVTIESCGGEPLQLNSISIVNDGGGAYTIREGGIPQLPGILDAVDLAQDPPVRPSINIPVIFTPQQEVPHQGTLTITSNDPQNETVDVPIRGRGANNDCPVAVVAQEELSARPLDVISLDGSNSTDPDGPEGRPVAYEWVVVQRPDGSTAEPVERLNNPLRPADGGPEDQVTTPGAVFFVDLAGTYIIDLMVTDSGDVTAPSATCPQPEARITINANPAEHIHLQLVWDTPGDPDQTDIDGSDVDLHFLHPLGADWFRGGGEYDCYFGNPLPNWGQADSSDDDPSLDIDDTNGAGPENINLDNPEDTQMLGSPYRVGVHYYRASVGPFGGADSWGPSDATLRIYLDGVLTQEFTRTLNESNDFWEVAGIIWAGEDRRVIEINRVSTRLP